MTPLLLAALLSAAPSCPKDSLLAAEDGEALAQEAKALLARLTAEDPGAPVGALRAELELSLEAGAASPKAASVRLKVALLRYCALAAEPRLPGAGAAERRLAAEILDRPQFRRARADPEEIRRRLRELWERLLGLLETGEAQRFAGVSRALFLCAAAAAALLWLFALRRGRAIPKAPREGPAPARANPADPGLTLARRAQALGDASAAIRLAFLAALCALERDGLVPPGRALTNGELLALLGRRERAALGPFAALAHLFDPVVYGGRPAGPAEARAALSAARALCEGGEE